MSNTPMLANCVQIEMGKTFETITKKINFYLFNYNFFHFYVVETCSKVGF